MTISAKYWTYFKVFNEMSKILLHLTSLVVLTSSAFLLMELIRVLTSERCTSQRTKYSRPSRLSLSFRHGRVSKWWILASNVWNTVNTLKCNYCNYTGLHPSMTTVGWNCAAQYLIWKGAFWTKFSKQPLYLNYVPITKIKSEWLCLTCGF